MVAEEEKFDGSTRSKRQRFYVELEYGETTIVSWKKLLKDAKKKDPCSSSGLHSSSSVASQTLRSPLDIKYDGGTSGKCNDSVISNKRSKHVNRATSSGQMQQSKHKVKMTNIEGEKNDGDSSIKLAGLKKIDAKLTAKTTNLSHCSHSPALLKDHPSEKLQTPMVDVPVLTYSRNPANFRSKCKCPPLSSVEDACVFPLKTEHNVLQKTNKISPEKSVMNVGVGGDLCDKMHQDVKDGYLPVKVNSISRISVHGELSSQSWHNDKSAGYREPVDAIPPCYKSSLKEPVSNQQIAAYIPGAKEEPKLATTYKLESKMEDKLCDLYEIYLQGLARDKDAEVQKLFVELAELWPKGVMDQRKLTEAISRSKIRRAVADKNQGQNVVDYVETKHDRIPCQKRKLADSSDMGKPIPSPARKTASKKATTEQLALQCKSSVSPMKGVKLTFKQKPLVPQNVKVKFLMKQERESLNSNEKVPKGVLNNSSVAAPMTCKRPT